MKYQITVTLEKSDQDFYKARIVDLETQMLRTVESENLFDVFRTARQEIEAHEQSKSWKQSQ